MKKSRLHVAADQDGLDRIFHAYDGFAKKHQIPDDVRRDVYVAVEEIVSNVVRHGVTDRTPTITMTLAVEKGTFTIGITDDGPAFDPFTSAPVPDVTQPLMERPIGGLGVLLVQQLTDAHTYVRRANRNCIMLRRTLARRREAGKTRKPKKSISSRSRRR